MVDLCQYTEVVRWVLVEELLNEIMVLANLKIGILSVGYIVKLQVALP